MLIDRIYQKVKTFVNTDGRGNVSPAEFNLFLHDAIQSRNEEYFHDINRLINRQNRGLITNALDNVADRYREKASHYLVSGVAEYISPVLYELPEDLRYIDTIGEDISQFEFCKDNRKFAITKRFANAKNPIFTIINNQIKVFPAVVDENNAPTEQGLPITYLRTIKFPRWTYAVIGEAEIFNPSALDFQDADIHPSEEDEIVSRVLARFGINLKAEDVQKYAQEEDSKEFNKNLKQ